LPAREKVAYPARVAWRWSALFDRFTSDVLPHGPC
jgi:hypothetical protein